MQMHFATVRMNAVTLALVGILLFSGATIGARLPQRIQRGERGQEAIAMLDAMRRPFLAVKHAEARLLETGDAQAGNSELSLAISSATELLERYRVLARYSVELSTNVGELSKAFETWVTAERHFFTLAEVASDREGGGPTTGRLMSDLASVTSGFLHTMDVLGTGEVPIHADIADGRAATRFLRVLVLLSVLYFTAAAFWLQRTTSKREKGFLEERLRLEQEARALERTLGEALTKVLSGFIPICASCKRIREDNQWTQIEGYVTKRTDAKFSHGICPACEKRLYGDFLSPTSGPTSP